MCNKCCCNVVFFALFIIIGIIGSIFPMFLICDSFINTIPNYDNFKDNWLNLGDENANFNKYNYTYYNNLQFINEQYRKLSDNRNLFIISFYNFTYIYTIEFYIFKLFYLL